jgi:MSHA biogenesis protein MshL
MNNGLRPRATEHQQKRIFTLTTTAGAGARTLLSLILALAGVTALAQEPETAPPATTPAPPQAEPRFSVNVDNAPARAFFEGLVAETHHNILIHPDVTGRISVSLKEVTLAQTLDAVRDLYGYDYRRVSTGYMILPANIQTRVFHLNFLDLQRKGVSRTRISSGQITQSGSSASSATGATGGGESSSETTGTAVMTNNDSDFWKAIEIDLRAIVGVGAAADRSVVMNKQSGVIVIRAMPVELRDVADYLQKTEISVTRQVVLEAKVIEVELNEAYQAGIDWAAVIRDGNKQYLIGQRHPPGGFDSDLLAPQNDRITVAPGNPLSGFLNNSLGGAITLAADFTDFNAFIQLLGLQGRTRVLSSPRVSTLHNQKAIIKAGSDEFFVTGIHSDTTTGTATTTTVEYELTPFFSGVALDVTPQIGADDTVIMHIHPTISDVTDQQKTLSVRGSIDVLPLALSQIRESDSIVKARNGQIIVIGGLMRETRRRTDYKTPVLGDIPGLGRLFRSERDQTTTTELVILLRPIVVSDEQWPAMVQEPLQRLDEMTNQGKLQPSVKPGR